jgi:hypothetical protein
MLLGRSAAARVVGVDGTPLDDAPRALKFAKTLLVTPLVALLVLGLIEFGMVIKDWLAVTSSVRSAAHVAAANPRTPGFAQDAAAEIAETANLDLSSVSELWIYKAAPDGTPVGGSGEFERCSVCVKFRWDASKSKFVILADRWPAKTQDACADDPRRDRVGVYLSVDHQGVTGLPFQMNLAEHSVMTLEAVDGHQTCK